MVDPVEGGVNGDSVVVSPVVSVGSVSVIPVVGVVVVSVVVGVVVVSVVVVGVVGGGAAKEGRAFILFCETGDLKPLCTSQLPLILQITILNSRCEVCFFKSLGVMTMNSRHYIYLI